MKRIIRFFIVCLALSVVQTGVVFGADNTRTGQKRDNSKNVSLSSSRSVSSSQKTETSRTTARTVKTDQNPVNEKRTVSSRSDKSRTTTVKKRNITAINTPRTPTNNVRTTSAVSRSAVKSNTPVKTVASRNATFSRASKKNVSRIAEINTEKASAIKSKDYSKCKTVFYECMDEFCANKDANLRRCSCSTRVHEFDKIKKQLSDAEDKMLDFNQRLLIVNLDKEDAAAINVASEGELAFTKKDSSESEKLLKKITDALNTSGDSKINNNLSSLSLDMDSAWDSVDSTSGIATTSKNGIDLYNAALPVCIDMAKEICSDEELDIAQSGYKLTIQQDCNTVAKSYNSQYNNAMNKIHESSALLDMARLNAYQQRNSDDVLTCKKKMLEQLSDESVCGKNLYKCLDTTGQYINPSTGEAFLSENLYNLTNLLTTPGKNETWAKVGQNDKFVSFLTTKKKFLEPAMEQCQDMADTIWKEFIGDALAQIKLAQNAKLEEVRQSCTKLVAECKTGKQETLADFDNRALSTFSVIADTTVNAVCKNVESSCVSLLNNLGDVNNEWKEGMVKVAADISYEKIIETCTTVGQNCIIQQCNGSAGNFSLCEDSASSPRRAILQRKACWDEVVACVKQAANLDDISTDIIKDRNNFYKSTYYINNMEDIDETTMEYIPKLCSSTDKACLLAEKIWGNCQYDDSFTLVTNSSITDKTISVGEQTYSFKDTNKILSNTTGSSLLSWFAINTGTQNNFDSCNVSSCPVNYAKVGNNCSLIEKQENVKGTPDGVDVYFEEYVINTPDGKHYCKTAVKDYWGNCCKSGQYYTASYANTSFPVCVPENKKALAVQTATCQGKEGIYSFLCNNPNSTLIAFCITSSDEYVEYNEGELSCSGFWIIIDSYGNYIDPNKGQQFMYYGNDKEQAYSWTLRRGWGYNRLTVPLYSEYNYLISYDNNIN